MRFLTVIFIFIANTCIAQQWQAEVMAGVTGYSGDLARSAIAFNTFGPAINVNIKKHILGCAFFITDISVITKNVN